MPDDFKKASPGRRKALSDIIGREAEAIFDRAQRSQEETAALHRVAELLFVEADRLTRNRSTVSRLSVNMTTIPVMTTTTSLTQVSGSKGERPDFR